MFIKISLFLRNSSLRPCEIGPCHVDIIPESIQCSRKTVIENTQLTFTCSKSTIETLEKGVKYVQLFNNKNTGMTSKSFWYFYC